MYICQTCDVTIKKKNKIPCQAVYNNLAVDDVPPELANLEKLEQILVSQRIVFQKNVVMPKGQQRKIRGAICNVPVSCEETCRVLPRPPDSSGIIMLKLKRKLQFRGHVYFQAVRPEVVLHALQWLKRNNELYENVVINLHNIDRELSSLGNHEQEIESGIAPCCETATFARDCDGDVHECEKEQRVNKQGGKDNGHCSQDGNLDSHASGDFEDDCETKLDSRFTVVRFCYHSYDYSPNWTPLSPITIINYVNNENIFNQMLQTRDLVVMISVFLFKDVTRKLT